MVDQSVPDSADQQIRATLSDGACSPPQIWLARVCDEASQRTGIDPSCAPRCGEAGLQIDGYRTPGRAASVPAAPAEAYK